MDWGSTDLLVEAHARPTAHVAKGTAGDAAVDGLHQPHTRAPFTPPATVPETHPPPILLQTLPHSPPPSPSPSHPFPTSSNSLSPLSPYPIPSHHSPNIKPKKPHLIFNNLSNHSLLINHQSRTNPPHTHYTLPPPFLSSPTLSLILPSIPPSNPSLITLTFPNPLIFPN